VFGPDSRVPRPRLFKGHFQRFLEHRSFAGYRYAAGELSIGRQEARAEDHYSDLLRH